MDHQTRKLWLGVICALICFGIAASWQGVWAQTSTAQHKRIDVNDISILWPAPKTPADVTKLIGVDEKLDDGTTAIWPEAAFKKVVNTAQMVSVTGSGGLNRQIKFRADKAAFESATNWKIAGIRIDPSAPGCGEQFIRAFGSRPQIRLIVQPVTVRGASAVVHDVTAHLVFDYVLDEPAASGRPTRAVPDRKRFKAVLDDLLALKASLLAGGVTTDGELGVHPAFIANVPDFSNKVKAFLKKHLAGERLNAVAFMGLDFPEPWIFFAMVKGNGGFIQFGHPSVNAGLAQMLSFRDGNNVTPQPLNSTFAKGVGVSTSQLFGTGVNLDAPVFSVPLPPGVPAVSFRDIPDIVANPRLSHFGNTDCVSCHSESTRRRELGLQDATTSFAYKRPAGISGVNKNLLPQDDWNVRNFGWFVNNRVRGIVVESVSMRTANETAESAEFINRDYLGTEVSSALGTTPAAVSSIPTQNQSLRVANALTLVMTIKSPEDRAQLKELITRLQSLPPDKNPITVALTKLGNVHFARFVFIGEDKLAVITTYDDDFETYIQSFVDEIGGVFDQLLAHMKDAPPLPVKDNAEKFMEYVRKNDLTCDPPFFSAYPMLRVQHILTLQKRGTK